MLILEKEGMVRKHNEIEINILITFFKMLITTSSKYKKFTDHLVKKYMLLCFTL